MTPFLYVLTKEAINIQICNVQNVQLKCRRCISTRLLITVLMDEYVDTDYLIRRKMWSADRIRPTVHYDWFASKDTVYLVTKYDMEVHISSI